MKVIRAEEKTNKPMLDSLPLGSIFHLGVTTDQTWLVCQPTGGYGQKMAACLETGELRPLGDMTDNVARLYHKAVLS